MNNQFENQQKVSTEYELLILLIDICDTCAMCIYECVCGTGLHILFVFIHIWRKGPVDVGKGAYVFSIFAYIYEEVTN